MKGDVQYTYVVGWFWFNSTIKFKAFQNGPKVLISWFKKSKNDDYQMLW